jgi:hypothetical protein
MRMQDEALGRKLRMWRFKIGITATIIDQIPATGSVE